MNVAERYGNMILISGRSSQRRTAAFSVMEVMLAAAILAIVAGSLFAFNSQVMNVMRRSTVSSYASQVIQERMEQFRRAAWTELTSNYPPLNADSDSTTYDGDSGDPDPTVYADDVYATDFPYDLSDLDSSVPGLLDVMSVSTMSAAQLPNVVERVTVECYNASSNPLDVFDADGTTIVTIQPFQVGATPIIVERRNGVVTTIQHNPVAVLNTTIRLTLNVQWTGTDNVTRTKEIVTLFTVEGDK